MLLVCGAAAGGHIQKALNEMNLRLHHVLSNILGESGQRILDAILAGRRDAHDLVSLVDRRVKKSDAEIMAALQGTYREEHLFVIRQTLDSVRAEQRQIDECDRRILAQLEKMSSRQEPPTPPLANQPSQEEQLAEQIGEPKKGQKTKGRPKRSTKTQRYHPTHGRHGCR